MTYELKFYRAADNEEPSLDYIRAQVRSHQAKIGRALRQLQELGHEARRPLVDYLGDGLYELRIPIEGHQHRLIYFIHARSVVVVTIGFLKKTDRVPLEIIARASRYRAEWLSRHGGEA